MTNIKTLNKELDSLKKKREEERKINNLKKEIRAEKFAQTKGGKIFNAIGDFGMKVSKKVFEPPKNPGKKKKVISVDELMKKLPQ